MTDLPGNAPEMADTAAPSPEQTDAFGRVGELSAPDRSSQAPDGADPLVFDGELIDPLSPSDHLRRRQMVSRLASASQTAAALFAVAVLGAVVFSVAAHAASVLSFSFLTRNPPTFVGEAGGGIAPEIVGTAVIVAIATAIAMPMGILIALYLTEFAGPRTKRTVRLALDLLNGMPTVIVGLFVFGLLVVGHHQSGFAGAFALAIIMLPLIARASQEVLLLVPSSLREAAEALGVSRWRTVRGVILPTARGGIFTATVLAVGRAAGETAPLIFVSSIFANSVSANPFSHEGLPNIPVYIFQASEAAESSGFARAWGAAFVVLLFILVANAAGRALNRRTSILSR
jgi:phosphate transport system permease protein